MNNEPKPTLNLPKGIDPTAWISEVLGTAGTIGGAILGGPIGAGVGGAAGSALGSALEQQLRDKTINRDKLLKEAIMSGVTGALFTGGAEKAGFKPTLARQATPDDLAIAKGLSAPARPKIGTALNQAGYVAGEGAKKAKPKNLLNKSWYRGVDKLNVNQADKFYSASKEVAGDYGNIVKLNSKNMPKNPLVVTDKDELAAIIKYKGDPFIQPKGMAKANLFDSQAKKYAQSKGFDSILYKSGSFESPELHVFSGVKAAPKKTTNIYYHGTPNPEAVKAGFDLTKAGTTSGSKGVYGKGIYLTNELERAKVYGTPIEVPLGKAKIKTIDSSKSLTELFARDTNYGDPDLVAKKFLDKGFDGIRVINKTTGSEELAIFNPSVLKIGSKVKPATVYYHGTSKKAAADIEKYGIDMVKAQGVDSESPYAFFTAPSKGDASWYGPAIVPVYPQGKIKVLSQSSELWAKTMGQSKSVTDSAKYAEQLRKMGYDMIESGNEQMILNPAKFKTATQLKVGAASIPVTPKETIIGKTALPFKGETSYKPWMKDTVTGLGANPKKYRISDETVWWADTWNQGDISGNNAVYMPSKRTVNELSKYKPSEPIKLYRGVGKNGLSEQEFFANKTGYESWTTDKKVAQSYAGQDGKLYEATVSPEDILVQWKKLPKFMKNINMDSEKEVIVRAGKYTQLTDIWKESRKTITPLNEAGFIGTGNSVPVTARESILRSEARKYNTAQQFVNEQFKATDLPPLKTIKDRNAFIKELGFKDKLDKSFLEEDTWAKTSTPNQYYHIGTEELMNFDKTKSRYVPGIRGGGITQINGMYLGRDPKALSEFYGMIIKDELGERPVLSSFKMAPKWLDLSKTADEDKFLKEVAKKYGVKQGSTKEFGDALEKEVIARGYDGVRYFDPYATGEEFVLVKEPMVQSRLTNIWKGSQTIIKPKSTTLPPPPAGINPTLKGR